MSAERTLMDMVRARLSDDILAESISDCVQGITRTTVYEYRREIDPNDPENFITVRRPKSERVTTKPADRARGLAAAQKLGLIDAGTSESLREISISDAYHQFRLPVDPSTVISERESDPSTIEGEVSDG